MTIKSSITICFFNIYRACYRSREIKTAYDKSDNEENAKKGAYVFHEPTDLRTRKTISLSEISFTARQG